MTSVSSIAQQYDVTTHDLFQLDSSNIQPEESQMIARSIHKAYHNFDGVVVTHGTDCAESTEVRYYMTSLRDVETSARAIRGH